MRILDAYPTRGLHRPGESVHIVVETDGALGGIVRAGISHLDRPVDIVEQSVEGPHTILGWQPPDETPRGYGVDIDLLERPGSRHGRASTAFDVLDTWTQSPRYGFMSDFLPSRSDLAAVMEDLARRHINALQFYDWQYRHDQFLAPSETFEDPLGRTLSQTTVQEAVETAQAAGMAALAYVAIYAASAQFAHDRPDWALYDEGSKAYIFGTDFLGLMNPALGTPWAKHLLGQCAQALAGVGFDGIHLDQYGEPRQAQDANHEPVDLPQAFADFISQLKAQHPEAPITMNAVKAWPLDALTSSQQDFTYIEVWPDATPAYRDLVETVLRARRSSPKPVVVAIYIPADRAANTLAAEAILSALGASRIGFGEGRRWLTDPYFPHHQALSAELDRSLRCFHDLSVRYGEVLGPIARHTEHIQIRTRPQVWTNIQRNGPHLGLSLVNLDLDLNWDEPHASPAVLHDIELAISGLPTVTGAWWASPDHPSLQPLKYTMTDGDLMLTVPSLDLWSTVIMKAEEQRT